MPKDKSVGKALRKALGLETIKLEVESRPSGKSLLMNPRRLAVFRYLWNVPCSHIRQVSRSSRIPVESLKWHLKMLEGAELIASKRFQRKLAFYPKPLIRFEDIQIFASMSDPIRKGIVRAIWKHSEGASVDLISSGLPISGPATRHHLCILEELGVIEVSREHKPIIYRLDGQVARLDSLYKKTKNEGVAE
jgi:predicted transcriptional regulator